MVITICVITASVAVSVKVLLLPPVDNPLLVCVISDVVSVIQSTVLPLSRLSPVKVITPPHT